MKTHVLLMVTLNEESASKQTLTKQKYLRGLVEDFPTLNFSISYYNVFVFFLLSIDIE